MKTKALTASLIVVLFAAAGAYAKGRQAHEGKITNIDTAEKTLTVAGERNQTWTINWNETTKVKGAKIDDLKVGDSIHFDVHEKDGKMWAAEIRRTHKAAM